MRDGRTVAVAPMAEMTKLQLVAAMLGRDLATVRAEGATAFHGHAHEIGRELLARRPSPGRPAGARRVGRGRMPARSSGWPACWAPGAPRPRARSSPPTGRTAARSASAAARSISRRPPAAIAAGIGFCSEDRKIEGIVPDMSVRENLTLALLPQLSRSGVVDEARQREIVERFIAGSASSAPAPSRRSASCPAATSRRCCSPAGCA